MCSREDPKSNMLITLYVHHMLRKPIFEASIVLRFFTARPDGTGVVDVGVVDDGDDFEQIRF